MPTTLDIATLAPMEAVSLATSAGVMAPDVCSSVCSAACLEPVPASTCATAVAEPMPQKLVSIVPVTYGGCGGHPRTPVSLGHPLIH